MHNIRSNIRSCKLDGVFHFVPRIKFLLTELSIKINDANYLLLQFQKIVFHKILFYAYILFKIILTWTFFLVNNKNKYIAFWRLLFYCFCSMNPYFWLLGAKIVVFLITVLINGVNICYSSSSLQAVLWSAVAMSYLRSCFSNDQLN